MTPPAPRRGRPARLSRPQIVGVALELVDAEGVDALTMRALARRLEADPMAVYRHVRDKADLLGAMCDTVVADLPALDPDGPWRPQVAELAGQLRERLAAHPALLPVLAGAPVTPAGLAVTQQALALLVAHGVPVDVAATGFGAVFSYVLGFALVEAALPALDADRDELRAGALAHLGDPDAPPAHLDEALALLETPGDFAFGLDLLLDGLERRAGGPVSPPGS
jgi:TetR/AcrR family tetracycline transcriptional repressor